MAHAVHLPFLAMIARALTLMMVGMLATSCGVASSPTAGDSQAAVQSVASSVEPSPTPGFTFEETREAPPGAIEILLTFGPDFDPKEATAKAGEVVFFLRNDKGDGPPAAHNFLLGSSLDAPPIAASPLMASGDGVVLTIADLPAGTYTYWCTVPSPDGQPHSYYGMVGTLTVTP